MTKNSRATIALVDFLNLSANIGHGGELKLPTCRPFITVLFGPSPWTSPVANVFVEEEAITDVRLLFVFNV